MVSTIKIKGMDCHGCVTSVTNAISKKDGVNNIKVSLKDENAVIDYDQNKISISILNETIEDLGFEVN